MIAIANGKYQEWLAPDGLLMLEGWARDGLSDEQIADNMGIASSTYYEWLKKHREISEAIKRGKAPVDIQVENALLKRALGYDWTETTEEIYGDGKKHVKSILRHVPPDPASMVFWLKNRKPKYWRNNPDAIQTTDDPLLQHINKLVEYANSKSKAD